MELIELVLILEVLFTVDVMTLGALAVNVQLVEFTPKPVGTLSQKAMAPGGQAGFKSALRGTLSAGRLALGEQAGSIPATLELTLDDEAPVESAPALRDSVEQDVL